MLIVWGLFKKLVIADNVGVIANKVFALESPDFFVLWAGVFAFAIQIYADFSAYTDIARGVAKWYGFDLIRNFARPYLATGPADFWQRWNISLSTWFRDYVYIPLGGSRRGPWRVAANIMITFLASGFWHGASWNYVLWGAYHGLLLDRRASRPSPSEPPARGWLVRPLQVAGMFVLTCVGWLIFRETELQSAVARSAAVAGGVDGARPRSAGLYLFLLVGLYSIAAVDSRSVGGARRPEPRDRRSTRKKPKCHWRRVATQAVLCGVMLAAILMLRSPSALNFIYFAF